MEVTFQCLKNWKELKRKKPPRRMAKCHKSLLVTKVLLNTTKVQKILN